MTRNHPGLHHAQVGLPVEFGQQRIFGGNVPLDISFQIVHIYRYMSIERFCVP